MKPLHLKLQAFGPFATSESIDFTQLGDQAFFLIHGPTGAGKTTLLDAICFALYGDTSGGERDPRDMRNANADPALRTEVTLEFALGSQRYRVTRSPAQERPSLRASGTLVREIPKAQLDALAEERWVSKATQPGRVSDAVRELLGFDSAQFRQVIVLPQGRFRELLTAKSQERQAILERLFQTELYRRVEELLKEQAAGIRREADAISLRRKTLLDQHALATPEALAARIAGQQDALAMLDRQEQLARADSDAARAALSKAEIEAQQLKRWKDAEEAFGRLSARREAMVAERARLRTAQRAAQVSPMAEHLAAMARDQAEAREALAQREQEVATHSTAARAAAEVLAGEQGRGEMRVALQREIAAREAMLPRARQMSALQARLADATKALVGATRARDTATAAVAKHLERQQTVSVDLERARAEAIPMATLTLQRDQAVEQQTRLAQYAAARARMPGLREALAAAEHAHVRAVSARDGARQALVHDERAWRAGQAARLASDLARGAPCPVCGGTEHPSPAAHAELLSIGDAQLDASRDALHRADEQVQATATRRHAAYGELAQAEARLADLAELARLQPAPAVARMDDAPSAPNASDDDIAAAARAIDGEVARLTDALKVAAQAAARLPNLEAAHADARGAHEAAVAQAREAEHVAQQLAQAAAQLEGEWRGACEQVPEDSRDPVALEAALAKARERALALEQALQRAQMTERDAASQLAAAVAALDAARTQLTQTDARHVQAQASFVNAIAAAGFDSLEAWQTACLPPAAMVALDEAVRDFELEIARAADRRERAEAEAKSLQPPDLPALQAARDTAAANLEAAIRQRSELAAARETLLQCQRLLDALEADGRDIETRYAVLGRLSEVANGNNPRRITFQRFVLASLLDEVLEAASQRLMRMSRGRYTLQRVREQVDQRSAGGLDLEVFDHDTGGTRPANTLSGGEGFLASLSLALGLADVVQSRAGGIQLDTLFVDEGFGTLDPESLDFAIRTLLDLQQAGRLVGIISHVSELRERIDVRLEVRPGAAGSHAVLQLP
ncbi:MULTISPECIES: SMC family ATPase [unclassified Cupriavidus]|uniref:SMC family ATPase n=1 Tax=unclassified Cupriavidus TaxID=2640874 RepID=UPI00313D39BE